MGLEYMQTSAKRERIAWVDNLRGFLAFLVLAAHGISWSALSSRPFLRQLWFIINSFHMVTFFALGGYVRGRTARWCGRWIDCGRLCNLAVPATVFGLFTALSWHVFRNLDYTSALLRSISELWFLWVMAAVDAGDTILRRLETSAFGRGVSVRKRGIVLLVAAAAVLLLPLAFKNEICNTIGKFAGYFLAYEMGEIAGSHLKAESEKRFFTVRRAAIPLLMLLPFVYGAYRYFGSKAIILAVYKIPVGIAFSYVLFSIFLSRPTFLCIFNRMGKISLQCYVFHVAVFEWVHSITAACLVWEQILICAAIIFFGAAVPILADMKLKDTRGYCLLFRPSDFFCKKQGE